MNLLPLLRKYWYVPLIAVVLIALLAYGILQSGSDPRELLSRYGYFVILFWTLLEGETIVVIAGWLSGSLGLSPPLIALSAFCGTFCSDQIMFSLGKYKGATVLHYFPRIIGKMDKAAALFKKYDTALILGFRFVYGVRNITPIMLGISGVSHRKFFILNFIGASVWALVFTYGGLLAGGVFMRVMHAVGHGIFFAILGVLALVALVWFIRSRRAKK